MEPSGMHVKFGGHAPVAQRGRGDVRIPWRVGGRKKLCGTVWPAGGLPDSLRLCCPQEVRDTGEMRELDCAQKPLPELPVAAGVQNQGFMKCLLEVEEEEATHRRAAKARALPSRKSPRILTPVPTAALLGSSAPSLPQTPTSVPAMAPSWARPPAPGPVPAPVGAPVPASVPAAVLQAPAPDLGWRRTELLHQSSERNLSSAKAR